MEQPTKQSHEPQKGYKKSGIPECCSMWCLLVDQKCQHGQYSHYERKLGIRLIDAKKTVPSSLFQMKTAKPFVTDSPTVNRSRRASRARSNRTFTVDSVSSISSAVSRTDIPSTSRKMNTKRYSIKRAYLDAKIFTNPAGMNPPMKKFDIETWMWRTSTLFEFHRTQ